MNENRIRSFVVGIAAFAAGGVSVLAVLGGSPAGAQGGSGSGRFWKEGSPPAATREAPANATAPAQTLPSLSGLIKTVSPSVVYIFTTKNIRDPHEGLRMQLPPGFRVPEPDGEGEQDGGYSARSLGSGFIISADGYIVTNNHVIADTSEIRVQLTDGRELPAKIVGRDPQVDLGLIKIDAKDLPVMSLGNSDKLEQGDWVVAMGNPLGLDHSASVGIVSGLARNIGIGRYDALLQTDAAINPGNSGGPLFNLQGEVVGINTAIVGGANNIGFAIPINMAKEILPDLKEFGKAVRGQLGVLLRPIDEAHKEALSLKNTEGALVQRVVASSPADRAGLKPGDVITQFNGQAVKEVRQLQRLVAATRPDSTISLTYVREGKTKEAKAKLVEYREENAIARDETERGRDDDAGKIGVSVEEITPGNMQKYGLKSPEGVVIRDVKRLSPAAEAGLEPGDVIREANRKKISSPKDFMSEVQGSAGKPLLLLIEREGDAIFLVISPKKAR